jgi:hypothetical protein
MAIRVDIDTNAKTMTLVPTIDADHEQLAALGFNEGGDCAVLVRQDIPGTSDLQSLKVIATPAQITGFQNDPKPVTVAGQNITNP